MTSEQTYTTEQEAFWAGEFGTAYSQRNRGDNLLSSNLAFFSRALKSTDNINSFIEFGANVGMNMKALNSLFPEATFHGIEINSDAAKELANEIGKANVTCCSILDHEPAQKFDLAFTKGVLIHIEPSLLSRVYDKLFASTDRYLLIAEYYNPTPIEVRYRGFENRMFKRDFAGELLDRFATLRLMDYGFVYHRDPKFPLDDLNWFLFQKLDQHGSP